MTPLGYIMLPVGLAGLFLSKRWLYRLFVFSTLFSATSAINFGDADNGSALQLWMFFGFLWLLRLTMEHLLTLSFSIDRRIVRSCLWLIAFLFVAFFSLIMPVYINGTLAIASPILGDTSEKPLYLTSHHFTQLLYLIFGVVTAICVAHSNLRDEDRHETERIILLSALFISVWGLFQFFCNLTGVPYPDYIFNNSISVSAKGFLQKLGDEGVGRISSVTLEPSVFAEDLLALLPLTLPAWLRKGSVLSVFVDRFCAVLFFVLLILSTSSTAYLGMLILGVMLWFLLLRTRTISMAKASMSAIIAGTASFAIVALAISSISVARNVFSSAILNKSSSGSALERAMTVVLAYGYFQKFPLLGVGWGSVTSHDLIIFLLSNVGIIGALTFLGAMLYVIRSDWQALEPLVLPMSLSRSAWFLSLAVFLFTSLVSGFPLVLGNFWLIVGMAIATGWKEETRQASTVTPEPV
jgi:hypothetical protein